jgi:hypothetical protein
MKPLKAFLLCLLDKKMMPTALKVSLVVGSLLFCINHGAAVVKGQMNHERCISAALTYLVPYFVNIHGQYVSRSRQRQNY